MEGVAHGNRGKTNLSNQISVLYKSNLRDVLRPKHDNNRRDALTGLTLGAVLGCESEPASLQVSRTLLDIIRDEESGSAQKGTVGNSSNRKNWRSFKDHLRLHRAGAALSSSSTSFPTSNVSLDGFQFRVSRPCTSDDSVQAPVITSSSSTSSIVNKVKVLVREGQESGSDSGNVAVEGVVAPVKTSLMALLETERQAGDVGSAITKVRGEREPKQEEEEEEEEGGEYSCCVCMVRHKGAAFIPCGHTFCRQCSRELWVGRGNCPLCNGFILEILDIF